MSLERFIERGKAAYVDPAVLASLERSKTKHLQLLLDRQSETLVMYIRRSSSAHMGERVTGGGLRC
jgi:hypothetical protein